MPLFDKPENRYEPEEKAGYVSAIARSKAIADKLGKPFNDKIGDEPEDGVDEVALDDLTGDDNLTTSGVMSKSPPTDKSTYVGAFAENEMEEGWGMFAAAQNNIRKIAADAKKKADAEKSGGSGEVDYEKNWPTSSYTSKEVYGLEEDDAPAEAWMGKIIPVDPHAFKKLASSGLGDSSPNDHFTKLKFTPPRGTPVPSEPEGIDQTDHFCQAVSVTLKPFDDTKELEPLTEGQIEKSYRQGIVPAMGNRRWSVPYKEIPYSEPLKELAYDKNTGAMEINKFYEMATPEQIAKFDLLVKDGADKQAWMMVQAVTGVKLVGDDEFGSSEELAFYRHEQGL